MSENAPLLPNAKKRKMPVSKRKLQFGLKKAFMQLLRSFTEWKKCYLLFTCAAIVSIATNLWVPLWVVPLIFWLVGLKLIRGQNSFVKKDVEESRNKNPVVQSTADVNQKMNWDMENIFVFVTMDLPSEMKRPMDDLVLKSLYRAAADTLIHFKGLTVYVHDLKVEYIMSSPPYKIEGIAHNSTKGKVISVLSSYLAVKFHAHLLQLSQENPERKDLAESVRERYRVVFSGRCIEFPNTISLLRHFSSATGIEAHCTGITKMAHVHFVPDEISDLSIKQIEKKLFQERGESWSKMPVEFRHGLFAKRIRPAKPGEPPKKYRVVINSMMIGVTKDSFDYLFGVYSENETYVQESKVNAGQDKKEKSDQMRESEKPVADINGKEINENTEHCKEKEKNA